MLSLPQIDCIMRKVLYIIIGVVLLQSCKQKSTSWTFDHEIQLEKVKPVGIAIVNDTLWVSDAEGNRIVQIGEKGYILNEKTGFDRPMHITDFKGGLAIPEYGKDVITLLYNGTTETLKSPSLDAPAAIDFYEDTYGIADFYHHKVHFFDGTKWISIGEKGKENGQFHYPTDIHISDEFLYVADAYNHRIQIFDKEGKFVKIMAADLEINAATGVWGNDEEVFLTDFENHRVIILNTSGEVKQILSEELSNPIDLIVFKNKLYVLNFKLGTISVFKRS